MDDALTLDELADAADVSPRLVRYYLERGLLPSPKFKSRATRYGPAYLPRLRAIRRLREEGLGVEEIQKRLRKASAEEIEALGAPPSVEPEAPEEEAASKEKKLPEGFAGPYRKELASERWEHVALCPGVVLMVKGEADAEAWRVAREIAALFGGR